VSPVDIHGVCGPFRSAANPREIVKLLIIRGNCPSVSPFYHFRGAGSGNLHARFRRFLAWFKLPSPFPQNSETVKRRPVSAAIAKGCAFQPDLERPGTCRNRRPAAPAGPVQRRSPVLRRRQS
jgi:hypothetical protein